MPNPLSHPSIVRSTQPPINVNVDNADASNRTEDNGDGQNAAKKRNGAGVGGAANATNALPPQRSVKLESRDVVEVSTSSAALPPPPMNNKMIDVASGPADDIDERDSEDPLCATTYVQDMYEHFRSKETSTSVRPVYMHRQVAVTVKMRSILVVWLVEVNYKFKLVPETLYLTVNIIDRYLSKTEVTRPKLQLVGVTSLFIASKYEEIYPPELRDLVYICGFAYSKLDVRLILFTHPLC